MVPGNASRSNSERILKPFENWKTKLGHEELAYFQKKGERLNKKWDILNDASKSHRIDPQLQRQKSAG
jgi:hypothetical protein